MRFVRLMSFAAFLLSAIAVPELLAQGAPEAADVPTFRATSSLVFLDVTVLDSKGHPVVKGLTKDDFTITEDKKPQRIFSFEAPDVHIGDAGDNPDGKAPATIFVLDLLNSDFSDFAYIRYSVRKYLASQPAQLASPAELMVIGNQSLELLQGYTRNKSDLLFALNHLPAALPYKKMNGAFWAERFNQSIDALQQIALQNKGIPGRKNIVWVGHGGPGLNTGYLTYDVVSQVNRYVHATTNMLVDARMSLFVIYPGLPVNGSDMSISAGDAAMVIGNDDPFAGDINFGVFVNETGGSLFYNRNDVDSEMKRSQELGSMYYTLTYQPHNGESNGKFRRIRVTLRDASMRVVTKAGYFAPDENAPTDPRVQLISNLSGAVRSTIPFSALDIRMGSVVRHPDSQAAEFTVMLGSRNFSWQTTEDGRSRARLILAAASLSKNKDVLAWRMEELTLTMPTQDKAKLDSQERHLTISLRIPRKTQTVRVAIGTEDGGRIGAAEVDRKIIDAAPAMPTPQPQLSSHRPGEADGANPANPPKQ